MKKVMKVLLAVFIAISAALIFSVTAYAQDASGMPYEPTSAEDAKYVPTFVATADDAKTQTLYNPYTASMALDMANVAYKIGNDDDSWINALTKYGYENVIRVENNGVYQWGSSETEEGTKEHWLSAVNATVGIKKVIYNGQTKYSIAIAFRGTNTEDFADVLADANIFKNSDGFHKGFADNARDFYNSCSSIYFDIDGKSVSLSSIINSMKTENSKYCMIVTGHSLGAAIADVFVGYNLYNAGVHPSNVVAYTFAAPRSASDSYEYPYTNIYNIINEDDWVPTIGNDTQVGTNFAYIPDDTFRKANYGSNYEAGHDASWWSSFTNSAFSFPAHKLKEVYKPITTYIASNTTDFTSYNTTMDNIWDNVIINQNCFGYINGNLSAGVLIFKNGSLEVIGNLDLYCLEMKNDNDYLLVNGNYRSSEYRFWTDENHLTAGTVEVKGDFCVGAYSGAYFYYESGSHKTVFSGNSTQTVSSMGYNGNKFENLILKNTDIIFSGGLYELKLCQDTTITNENGLWIHNDLDLNGHKLTVSGGVGVGGEMIVSGTGNKINGNLSAGDIIFNNGSLEVNGNLDFNRLSMTHNDDYLLVNGDYRSSDYNFWSDENHLTAGIVEVKGNFHVGGFWGDHYYYETGTHKTVFSGNGTQTIFGMGYSVNKFENLILINTDVYFQDGIYDLTLCQDTTITNANGLWIHNDLDLNGHKLTVSSGVDVDGKMIVSGKGSKINGNLSAGDIIFKNGCLEVTGNLVLNRLEMRNGSDYLLVNGKFTSHDYWTDRDYHLKAGTVEVKGDFDIGYGWGYPCYYETGTHKTVLSGNDVQTVSGMYNNESQFSTLVLENKSKGGVVFNSEITVSTLFNHNGNKFTLYNDGEGSVFPDYDGDGLKDHVDPYPTSIKVDTPKLSSVANIAAGVKITWE
ncbi:MAG: lipase family protein, partial [Eubacterium sp.]|nr:lipase family protein [Eubacterium sp.]